MSNPTPRGRRAPLPTTTFETRLVVVETVIPDDADDDATTPRPNRATRRALNRKKTRRD